jgi:hypothetical protein
MRNLAIGGGEADQLAGREINGYCLFFESFRRLSSFGALDATVCTRQYLLIIAFLISDVI